MPALGEFDQSQDIGVYLIRHKVTGDSYVGASAHLGSRLCAHLTAIRKRQDINGADYGRRPPFNGVFCGCKDDDIEVRIIEHTSAKDVFAREQHWIDTLKPSLNTKGRKKSRVDVASLPTGVGDLLHHPV